MEGGDSVIPEVRARMRLPACPCVDVCTVPVHCVRGLTHTDGTPSYPECLPRDCEHDVLSD